MHARGAGKNNGDASGSPREDERTATTPVRHLVHFATPGGRHNAADAEVSVSSAVVGPRRPRRGRGLRASWRRGLRGPRGRRGAVAGCCGGSGDGNNSEALFPGHRVILAPAHGWLDSPGGTVTYRRAEALAEARAVNKEAVTDALLHPVLASPTLPDDVAHFRRFRPARRGPPAGCLGGDPLTMPATSSRAVRCLASPRAPGVADGVADGSRRAGRGASRCESRAGRSTTGLKYSAPTRCPPRRPRRLSRPPPSPPPPLSRHRAPPCYERVGKRSHSRRRDA